MSSERRGAEKTVAGVVGVTVKIRETVGAAPSTSRKGFVRTGSSNVGEDVTRQAENNIRIPGSTRANARWDIRLNREGSECEKGATRPSAPVRAGEGCVVLFTPDTAVVRGADPSSKSSEAVTCPDEL